MTDATKIEKQQQKIAKGVLKKIKLNQAEVMLIIMLPHWWMEK